MTDCILYTRSDDSVVIIHPAAHAGPRGESAADALARIIHVAVPLDAIKVLVVDSRNLPTDYRFNGAWELQGANITTNMQKARQIHRERIRAARAPLLAQLDVDYQRADEAEDIEKKREIAGRKQQLRDATEHPDIEAAQTPDELANVWPLETTNPQKLVVAPVLVKQKPDPDWGIADLLARAGEPTPHKTPPGIDPDSAGELPGAEKLDNPPIIQLSPVPEPQLPEVLVVPPLVEPPQDDAGRRRAAKGAIRRAVASMAQNSHDLQMRYELALQAHNGSVEALDMMAPEAGLKGISSRELAEQIIVERRARERRMMQVYAAQERAFRALEAASGEAIAIIEAAAVREIRADADAIH
jgi:hypothetical protein